MFENNGIKSYNFFTRHTYMMIGRENEKRIHTGYRDDWEGKMRNSYM
jgi:hypothetical protein